MLEVQILHHSDYSSRRRNKRVVGGVAHWTSKSNIFKYYFLEKVSTNIIMELKRLKKIKDSG